ncbi:cupin domain-containing protein [Nocardia alni]|uniref:cupin domain-containing protein n=1 Tax=Nocardia alni TaxID=2815723 RepID=UPI001C2315A7|nr:cupin domain-containing protein [Nocardia alni]
MSPSFSTEAVPQLGTALLELLPEQGSFELQHDQPGKVHDWHHHSLDEELFILRGEALLFWVDENGEYRHQYCERGTWITLTKGTRHGSVAGPEGAVYMIRPQNGRSAITTFLAPTEHPRPAPAFARATV